MRPHTTKMSMEEKVDKKFRQPNLEGQKHVMLLQQHRPAQLANCKQTRNTLNSIEETLKAQNVDFTPTAYFAAALALLKQVSKQIDTNAPQRNNYIHRLPA